MIIDIHTHPFCKEAHLTPSVDEAADRMMAKLNDKEKVKTSKGLLKMLFQQNSIENMITDMNNAGIDKAVIVAMDLSTHYGVEMVTNEDVGRFASTYPDRLIPFASVDPSNGRLAIDQLTHAVNNLGCKGLKLVPPVQHFNFSDPNHFPLWETAQSLDIIVWTHASHQMSHPDSDARLGYPMLLEPIAHQFPDLKLVLGHCGFPWVWEAWSLVVRHPNVYLDISAYPQLYNHFPWDAYSKSDAENKLLFATDYPLYSFQEVLTALDEVDISPEFKRKILHENASKLLGII